MAKGKTYAPLTQRFRDAYFRRIPDALRTPVRDEFCEVFGIAVGVFHHKLLGTNRTTMTELEIKWMEDADPFAIKAKRNEPAHTDV